jgi:ABC-type multidrug transport system ATPase subunit/ABC-type multidrug transport system permease subunit
MTKGDGGPTHVINTAPLPREDVRNVQRDARAFGKSRIAFRDLQFCIPGRTAAAPARVILTPTSGVVECGEMVAIMGPSGCGKTTLLDMVAAKKTTAYDGEVFFNGLPRDDLFARLTSYVPQQDLLPAHITVYEAVKFVHELRVEANMSPDEREAAVMDVLRLLGLDSIRDELIGDASVRGISGGQKRRVTLARGLAGGSQIVFADEPTSGLSSTDAETVVRAMAVASARTGVAFVTVIHQPRAEVMDLYHSLILLTSSPGRVVYNGAYEAAAAYFAAAGSPVPSRGNPADFFLDVITPGAHGERSNFFAQRYVELQRDGVEKRVEASLALPKLTPLDVFRETAVIQGLVASDVHATRIAASFTKQLKVLMERTLTITKRNRVGLRLPFGVSIAQGVVVGLAFFDIASKPVVSQISFFFMLLQMGTIANMSVMPELIGTRLLLKNEEADALYSTGASIVVQSSVNNTLAVTVNFITCLLMFAFSQLSWSKFGTLYAWSLLNFLSVTNYLRCIAAIAPNAALSVQTAMPGLLFFILFNNFFVNKATAPVFIKWAIYISPMAWAIEPIVILISPMAWAIAAIVCGICFFNADLVAFYGYDASTSRTVTALGVLLGEMIFFQCLEVILLKRSNSIVR